MGIPADARIERKMTPTDRRKEEIEKAARHYAESQFYYDTDEDKGIAFQAFCEGVEWNHANPAPSQGVREDRATHDDERDAARAIEQACAEFGDWGRWSEGDKEDTRESYWKIYRLARKGMVPAAEVERLKYWINQFMQAYAADFFDEPEGFTPKLDMNSAALVRRTLTKILEGGPIP